MRITSNVVQTVAKHAQTFTGDAFRFGWVGGDIGHGTRYVDGLRQIVWLGATGSRQAAAYYIGAMLGWARATGTEIPDDVRELCQDVQASYQVTRKALQWEEQGQNDAKARAEVAAKKPTD